jgi:hypothetical protein
MPEPSFCSSATLSGNLTKTDNGGSNREWFVKLRHRNFRALNTGGPCAPIQVMSQCQVRSRKLPLVRAVDEMIRRLPILASEITILLHLDGACEKAVQTRAMPITIKPLASNRRTKFYCAKLLNSECCNAHESRKHALLG